MKRKLDAPRNYIAVAARFRLAGPHGKNAKRLRRSQQVETRKEMQSVRVGKVFDLNKFNELASRISTKVEIFLPTFSTLAIA
jgi:hypothetical protein